MLLLLVLKKTALFASCKKEKLCWFFFLFVILKVFPKNLSFSHIFVFVLCKQLFSTTTKKLLDYIRFSFGECQKKHDFHMSLNNPMFFNSIQHFCLRVCVCVCVCVHNVYINNIVINISKTLQNNIRSWISWLKLLLLFNVTDFILLSKLLVFFFVHFIFSFILLLLLLVSLRVFFLQIEFLSLFFVFSLILIIFSIMYWIYEPDIDIWWKLSI